MAIRIVEREALIISRVFWYAVEIFHQSEGGKLWRGAIDQI